MANQIAVPTSFRVINVKTNQVKENNVNTLEHAIQQSASARFVNWMGQKTMNTAKAVAPVIGKVEVLAVPVTAQATASTIGTGARVLGWMGNKAQAASDKAQAFAVKHTPMVPMTPSVKADGSINVTADQLRAIIDGAVAAALAAKK